MVNKDLYGCRGDGFVRRIISQKYLLNYVNKLNYPILTNKYFLQFHPQRFSIIAQSWQDTDVNKVDYVFPILLKLLAKAYLKTINN
jgi:hypothetical protein